MSTIGEQSLETSVVIKAGDDVGAAGDPHRWTIVSRDGYPVEAVPPGGKPGVHSSDFLVARAGDDVDQVLSSEAFQEIEPQTPVVVFEGEDVVGVWTGQTLEQARYWRESIDIAGSPSRLRDAHGA